MRAARSSSAALDPGGGGNIDSVTGRITFEGVSFAYPVRPDVRVLNDIDLVLEPGTVTALVGPSGAGKSTVAALMLRLYDPGGGAVLLDGRNLRELDARWLRTRIGTVAQEPVLFSTSIAANIRYGRPDATDDELVVVMANPRDRFALKALAMASRCLCPPERLIPDSPITVS